MAETPQTPWRAAWVRAVARKVKAWADAVLAEEVGTASVAGALRPETVSGGDSGTGAPSAVDAPGGSSGTGAPGLEALPGATWGTGAPHLESMLEPTPGGEAGTAFATGGLHPDGGRSGTGARPGVASRAEPGAAARVATAAPPGLGPMAPGASLEALEARWLRDIEARRSVPINDWVARVNKGAPRLMQELARAGLVPPAPPRDSVATADVSHGAPASTAAPGEPRPVVQYLSPPGADARGGGTDVRQEPTSFDATGTPRQPAASALWSTEPEPTRSGPPASWGLGPENFAAFRVPPVRTPVGTEPRAATIPSVREPPVYEPPSSARRSPWDDLPPFASEERALRTPTRVPPPPLPFEDAVSPASAERARVMPAGAWREEASGLRAESREPPRHRLTYLHDEATWDAARAPPPWRPRLVEAPLPSPPEAQDEPTSSTASPWPELPPAPVPESTDAVVELRQWERRRRLDREQRGE